MVRQRHGRITDAGGEKLDQEGRDRPINHGHVNDEDGKEGNYDRPVYPADVGEFGPRIHDPLVARAGESGVIGRLAESNDASAAHLQPEGDTSVRWSDAEG